MEASGFVSCVLFFFIVDHEIPPQRGRLPVLSGVEENAPSLPQVNYNHTLYDYNNQDYYNHTTRRNGRQEKEGKTIPDGHF